MAVELELLRNFAAEDAVGWQSGMPLDAARFCAAAAAFAGALPRRRYVLNLCEDRLRFMLGFGAAMIAGQVSLLPYSRAPEALRQVLAEHSDAYCLADHGDVPPGLPVTFVPAPAAAARAFDVPRFPAERVALIAYTSGSSGRPQAHAQTWGALVADARALGRQLQLNVGERASVVGTVPPQHIYGMETTVMLPLQNGLRVHPGRPLLPADLAAALAAVPAARWLVTTPAHLRACVAESALLPPLAGILSATMPLATALAREVEHACAAPLHEIYGCTEGGALALRRPALESRWRVREGMRLTRADSAIWVEGGHLAAPLRIPDRVRVLSDTEFELLGRPEDMKKIAGKRASIEALNAELRRVPGVEDGVFFDPGGSARLAAVVVAPGVAPQAILRALRQRIDAAFLPRPLIMTDALPRTTTGKVARAALLALLEDARARHRHPA